MLVTCAKDKSVKFWAFPESWIDESNVIDAQGGGNKGVGKEAYSLD